ncbi:hypothetical protein AGMMS49950_08230 [Endomicrobiia bacterium]|nr:hypothetical protein AGMMS49531_08110 [Endomicrobiia bacterium]GHT71504.1 hypothetical protein AGMMS49950_08230 [Endomicrobiia bacterium]
MKGWFSLLLGYNKNFQRLLAKLGKSCIVLMSIEPITNEKNIYMRIISITVMRKRIQHRESSKEYSCRYND